MTHESGEQMGTFIEIILDEGWASSRGARALVKECPVDIFEAKEATIVARAEQEDECTLCELCLRLAPTGKLTIRKLYKDEQLHSHGKSAAA